MRQGKIFAVYKPKGITSFDVVREVRRITGERKVGHAGTLDPLAEGVLVIAMGDATKRIADEVAKEKEYEALVRLGMTSTTDDEEGEKTMTMTMTMTPNRQDIEAVLKKFVGAISQVPPIYSAIKVKGRSAYKYARKAQSITLEPREIFIKDIRLIKYEWPFLEIAATTGPGVYIRSLARDIGLALATGGYLAGLKRTRVGNFAVKEAVRYNELERYLQKSE